MVPLNGRPLFLSFLFAAGAVCAADQPADKPAGKSAASQAQKPAAKRRRKLLRKPNMRNPLKMPPGRKRPETSPSNDYEVKAPTMVPQGFAHPTERQPWPVRLMVHSVRQGMFIGLPVVDTDPNRGITSGIMPILVVKQAEGGDRITSIWAPSVTYNKTFKANGTIRYYGYPTRESELVLRASWAQVNDREAMGEYVNRNVYDKGYQFRGRVQYSVDGSNRFFGIGPDTSIAGESNYSSNALFGRATVGVPLVKDSGWLVTVTPFIATTKISDGPIKSIPQIADAYPGRESGHHHQNSNLRVALDFDSRDEDISTTQGTYLGVSIDNSARAIGSEYDYRKYGVDYRQFHKWGGSMSRHVTAGNLKFEQIEGNPPFWLMPQLGGKYVHRAYGEGRYIDRGVMSAQLEHRYTVYTAVMSGVSTDFEVAPFAGVGTVFRSAGEIDTRYLRPVFGGALRAVARPQVVGSIDFGMGQEGLAAFMDINYSW